MGIQSLIPLLKDECPDQLIKSNLSAFRGHRIAVDISIYLNQFIKFRGSDAEGGGPWVDQFVKLMCILKKNKITAIAVFDGPNPPPEKKEEQNRRRGTSQKILEKAIEAERISAIIKKKYNNDVVVGSESSVIPDQMIADIRTLINVKEHQDLTSYNKIESICKTLKVFADKKKIQTTPIVEAHKVIAKKIIKNMGIPFIQCDGEAEGLCAYLCIHGKVDAVLSEDTDVLAYKSPIFINHLNIENGDIMFMHYDSIIKSLKLTTDEFQDLCILLSCDYNSRIKGFVPGVKNSKVPQAIGPVKALKMIREYSRIEEMEHVIPDIEPLNYRRCRELFTVPEDMEYAIVPYSKKLDTEEMTKFLEKYKCRTTIDYIIEVWKPAELVFD